MRFTCTDTTTNLTETCWFEGEAKHKIECSYSPTRRVEYAASIVKAWNEAQSRWKYTVIEEDEFKLDWPAKPVPVQAAQAAQDEQSNTEGSQTPPEEPNNDTGSYTILPVQ